MNPMQSLLRLMTTYRRRFVLAFVAAIALMLILWPSETPRNATESATHVSHDSAGEHHQPGDIWTCAMHPHVRHDEPGRCPICGMDLVRVSPPARTETPRLTVSEAQRDLMRIETVPVMRRFPIAQLRLVGKVSYDETRLAHISAWVPGRIEELYVDFTGVRVREGDHMVRLYSPELYSAQEEFIQATDALTKLSESGIESLIASAHGTLSATREKLRRLGMEEAQIRDVESSGRAQAQVTIYAPTGGVVIERHASEGMYLDTGTRILTIADLDTLWVQLDAYESDLEWLRYGQTVEFTAEALPGEVFHGAIAFIDPALNSRTRTASVRVNVDNRRGILKPEMFVRAQVQVRLFAGGRVIDESLAGKWISPMHPEIVKDEPGFCDVCGMALVQAESLGYQFASPEDSEAPLVIPASAALLTGTRAVVYLQDANSEEPTYIGREVTLGARAGDFYLVEEGLAEGDLVVVSGNFKIDSALAIQAKPSMMQPVASTGAPTHEHRH